MECEGSGVDRPALESLPEDENLMDPAAVGNGWGSSRRSGGSMHTFERETMDGPPRSLTSPPPLPSSQLRCNKLDSHQASSILKSGAQAVGFIGGYFLESFRVTVYAVFLGVALSSLLCVPDWGN